MLKNSAEYVACIVPAAPIRKKPSHKVEMVNQLLFGETMRVLKSKNNWLKIQSLHDNYEGWIRNNLVIGVEQNFSQSFFVTTELINVIKIAGINMHVPVGSTLPGFNDGVGEIGPIKYTFSGPFVDSRQTTPGNDQVRVLTTQWVNAPYLWGGRTPFGVDCSGFVQLIFKILGVNMPRDARLQVHHGMELKTLQEGRCGDLAFFRHRKRKITHVGILLSPSEIVHASGRVRIDIIDDQGIINTDTGTRTHSLVALRRHW